MTPDLEYLLSLFNEDELTDAYDKALENMVLFGAGYVKITAGEGKVTIKSVNFPENELGREE